jgi:hypothetical protein
MEEEIYKHHRNCKHFVPNLFVILWNKHLGYCKILKRNVYSTELENCIHWEIKEIYSNV